MNTILITGASGFLGRYLASHFTSIGWRVVGVDSSAEENAPRENLSLYCQMRLPDPEFDQLLIKETPGLIVHAAGRASVPLSVTNPERDFDGNTVLTFKLLDAVRRCSPKSRFVLLSSAAVYGNPWELPVSENCQVSPISPYGFHKRQAELACEEFAVSFGISTCSLRIFSAYGPGLRRQVLWDIVSRAHKSATIKLFGTGEETRDFIHAKDVAMAVDIVSTNATMTGEVYNTGSGCETSIADLAKRLLEALQCTANLEFDGEQPSGVPVKWRADISRLTSLGFQTSMPFADGITQYVNWAVPLLQ